MRIFKDTKIDFLGKKFFALGLSILVIAISIGFIFINGVNLGIDFIGGHLVQLRFQEEPDLETLRAQLQAVGYGTAMLQRDMNDRNVIMIRVQKNSAPEVEGESTEPQSETPSVVEQITNVLRTDSDIQNEGKLDLNLEGKERLIELLSGEGNDPLGYLETNPVGMSPQVFARREYRKVAEQLIDNYRDQEIVRQNESGEPSIKHAGIILNLDDALNSVTVPRNREEFVSFMKEHTFAGSVSRIRSEMVSAVVGSELSEKAIWAVLYSLAGIFAYVWFRFNNRFSLAAIIALVHDVIITLGVFTIVGREINLPIVAAILTIVGYSLNDTIVIFVRIRENQNIKRQQAKEDYEGLLNQSINTTLSRTLLTSGTTLIVVLFLYFMGGSVINDFAFTLLVGVFVGTYSSIFVASPVLAIWQKFSGTLGGETAKVKTAAV